MASIFRALKADSEETWDAIGWFQRGVALEFSRADHAGFGNRRSVIPGLQIRRRLDDGGDVRRVQGDREGDFPGAMLAPAGGGVEEVGKFSDPGVPPMLRLCFQFLT